MIKRRHAGLRLVWLSSLGAIGFSRAASFDIVLTMTVAGAFAFFANYRARSTSDAIFKSRDDRTWRC